MITISTRDYTTEQLKTWHMVCRWHRAKFLSVANANTTYFVPESVKPMRYVMTFLTHGVTCMIR